MTYRCDSCGETYLVMAMAALVRSYDIFRDRFDSCSEDYYSFDENFDRFGGDGGRFREHCDICFVRTVLGFMRIVPILIRTRCDRFGDKSQYHGN